MKPIVSHQSAVEFWRSVRIGDRKFQVLSSAQSLFVKPPKEGAFDAPGPWWLERPLHVMVNSKEKRRPSKTLVCHVQERMLPRGSIWDVGNGFCASSPELSFVQAATWLDVPHLVKYGYEICGTYDTSSGTIHSCEPLTTIKRLTEFVAKAKGLPGQGKALRALKYVGENSASPRETLLAMLLCLPNMLGGYGIEMPALNYRIDLIKRASKVAKKSYCICDLYWPDARLAVEYDSDEFHVGEDRISKDSARRLALAEMGIEVVSVTNSQLNDGGSLNSVAKSLASRIGKKLRYKDPAFTHAHLGLRSSLQEER